MLNILSPHSEAHYTVCTGAFVFIFISAVIVQRLFFHNFSKVPGPFLARITSLYSAWHSWRGTMHLDVQRCHQEYGDLIRYSPNQILSLYPPDLTAIYAHGRPFRKSKGYATMLPLPNRWSTMTSIDKNLHHNLRRVFRSGVTTENLARYEPVILRNMKVYFSQLIKTNDSEGWSPAADMRQWNLCLGFDTMAEFGLGLRTNLLCDSARDYVFPALHTHEKKMGLWEQLPLLNDLGVGNFVGWILPLVYPKANRFASWFRSFLDEALATNATQSNGIFGPVIQSGHGNLDKPGHNWANMIGEGAFSTFSSADAYGMMISGFLHYVSHYPYVYERLSKEVRAKYKPDDHIVWNKDLESLVYLRAVIDEVMRLLPPARGVHWRECERGDIFIGKAQVRVPVGGDVGMSLFALFRDGRIFRDPVRFWPERWIEGVLPEEEQAHARLMFTPFSIRPRNCAGAHVAIMIASIAYVYILVNYDFRLGKCEKTTAPNVWSNTPNEVGADKELVFESHYSIAGWLNGPFIEFKARPTTRNADY